MRVLLAIGIALGLGACATVQPWERGALAHHSMDPSLGVNVTQDDFVIHSFDVREGGACSGRSAGGGCGCN